MFTSQHRQLYRFILTVTVVNVVLGMLALWFLGGFLDIRPAELETDFQGRFLSFERAKAYPHWAFLGVWCLVGSTQIILAGGQYILMQAFVPPLQLFSRQMIQVLIHLSVQLGAVASVSLLYGILYATNATQQEQAFTLYRLLYISYLAMASSAGLISSSIALVYRRVPRWLAFSYSAVGVSTLAAIVYSLSPAADSRLAYSLPVTIFTSLNTLIAAGIFIQLEADRLARRAQRADQTEKTFVPPAREGDENKTLPSNSPRAPKRAKKSFSRRKRRE